MKIGKVCLIAVTFVFSSMAWSEEPVHRCNLMPVPANAYFMDGQFRVDATFTVSVRGNATERLYKGATRMLRKLSGRTGLFFSQDFVTPETETLPAGLILHCNRPGRLVLGEDESYSLTVSSSQITLTAETDIGALRGLETVLQLLDANGEGYFFPAMIVEDRPRFPWRGLMMDVCRHFMPVDVIKRNLDGMAAVKMNVFHWHLTEDQGFRIECKTYSKLHELGSDGLYYTQEEVKDILSYAADRGIRVVPEFDIPGHATSWFVGHPELASTPGPFQTAKIWDRMRPAMDPTREEVYQFLDGFFQEMAQLFPDEYIHIGGDEVDGSQWDGNRDIQRFMKQNAISDNAALQRYFNIRILNILTKYGKKMVGWDEIIQPELPKTIVIQSWRGREAMVESAQKGYRTLLSNGYYLDLIEPTDRHYLNDPVPEDSPLSEEEKKYILGGEAAMWSEYVSEETVDSRIWPRTAAIAERLWSSGSVKDVEDMYRRLERISVQLEELGLTHETNYGRLLRLLTHGKDISALKNLVDVIEPVKGYKRAAQQKYASYFPLTRVVDAARPDAKIARNFRHLVDDYLLQTTRECAHYEEICRWLMLWKENHARLRETIAECPILKEIEPLSEDLSFVAQTGLDAMNFLCRGEQAPKEWVELQFQKLNQAKTPRGQTELMIVSAIEKLVKRTGEKDSPKK